MDPTYGQNWGESKCKQDFGGETYEVIRARRIWKKDITGGAVWDRRVVETESGPYSMVVFCVYVEPADSVAPVLCRNVQILESLG